MTLKAHILIVDDDANTLASLSRAFRLAGHEATVCDNAARALELVKSERFDLILSDVVMPGKDGIALLEDFRKGGVTAPVVMMSGQATIEMAVKSTRLGATDFLEKPISTEKLLWTVENALRIVRLEAENRDLKRRLGRHQIVWVSAAMRELMAQVDQVAQTETRVCIRGETGTGKELIARALHEKGNRREGPFISLNCAAIPAELLESELFGHEKGSFTGAAGRHVGKFEQAHRGTLFLDEIGDMPLTMQAKLLRVLEEGEIERLGGDKPIAVDVRIIVATHRNLEEQVRAGTFREDLYHRIFVFPIVLPPLRERRDDIPALVEHFARQIAEQNGWKAKTFSSEAMSELEHYPWPGNVRELRNVIERVLLLNPGDQVEASAVLRALPQSAQLVSPGSNGSSAAFYSGALAKRVEDFERETLLNELKQNHYHMTKTAKALGLERSHLYKKCQQLGIDLRAIRQVE
ncbi:MAG TPA: sigma-54 dependent transcriptional regulator [Candidatus Limnocylindrales bacterium]|nr:sigma-54 dependent transcriptional regulator [Candidatus Limnocylindrales bacterium]